MTAKRAKAPPPAAAAARKIVLLAAVLDLKAVAPLADELLALRGCDVTIDASGVQCLGAQCLQVLLSARKLWQADWAAFLIADPSEPMRSAIARSARRPPCPIQRRSVRDHENDPYRR